VTWWVYDCTGVLPRRLLCVASSFTLADQEAVTYQRAHPFCAVVIEATEHGVCQEIYRTIVWTAA
jgi:hypothetical protein